MLTPPSDNMLFPGQQRRVRRDRQPGREPGQPGRLAAECRRSGPGLRLPRLRAAAGPELPGVHQRVPSGELRLQLRPGAGHLEQRRRLRLPVRCGRQPGVADVLLSSEGGEARGWAHQSLPLMLPQRPQPSQVDDAEEELRRRKLGWPARKATLCVPGSARQCCGSSRS